MSAAVFFDVDGTLIRLDRPYEAVLGAAAERCGIASEEEFLSAYFDAFVEEFQSFADDPYRGAAATAADASGVEADPERFADAVLEAELEASTVEPGTRDLLERLGDSHRLGVLSNGLGRVQRAKLAEHGLLDPFDAHCYSYDVGAHKPEEAIFTAATAAIEADRYVYVADEAGTDLVPAREAGFLAVHLNADAPADQVAVPDFEALGEVATLFGR